MRETTSPPAVAAVGGSVIALAAVTSDLEADVAKLRRQMKRVTATVIVTAVLAVGVGAASLFPRMLGGGPAGGFTPPTGAQGSAAASQTATAGQ